MAIGSGIGGQMGLAAETTYGTPVTPTRFLPVTKAEAKLKKTIAQGEGLVPGMLAAQASQRVVTLRQGTVALDTEVLSGGFGLLWQLLMGSTGTPAQQGATAAYLQSYTLADPIGKSLTIQVGVTDTSGVVHPYTASGCKVTECDLTVDINATTPVMATWTIDAANVTEVPVLAAPSYTTPLPRPFVGTDATILAGTFGSETAASGVTKVELKIPRPMKTTRFYFGNAGVKSEPITNAHTDITGTITADFVDKTLWADRFASDAPFSLKLQLQGALIATPYYQGLTITLPTCYLEGDTPVLDSADVISGAFPFSWRFDGTHYPTLTYTSTDPTV